ncbi:type I restriction-modification system subunit M [Aliarcobacter cryaerophilus]|uniref:type I restriction-modification system subunit M n=1 Tax=Aliarcobacter cryaerophilus TaxID=28198 RepID=UPI0021B6D12E|nr:type I restriction-modification system subunit M [Aliarcobacter cryaerophilus]MCT7486189.1 type I restriction-modification system subunit M [Aliarcobacter cryaerophilus]MCT7490252.1 type I restriction-modification system subunit M [Aliarcobacter cryaerophilus]
MKQKITLQKLENFLFSLADDLRAKMDANEYKYYIIGLIFLKRLSDEFVKAKDNVEKRYKHLPKEFQAELIEDKTSYGDMFFVPKQSRWWEGYTDSHGQVHPPIKDVKSDVGQRLNIAIAAIEENNDRLNGVLKNNINFNSEKGKNNERVKDADWISLINKLTTFGSLSGENFEFHDLLGAAYEYLIKYFADSAGKKGGEFYTPAEVVRLLVQITDPKEGESVYDPTVGSGGMLIQSHQYIEENSGNTYNITLNGQENDGGVWATCIMNMILHDVKNFEIEHGNTLEEPMFKDLGGKYKKFDKILANPPFSMSYKKENLTQTSRFRWGYAPESKKADLMFVEHMASSLKNNGLMAVVVPHGVLFRGSKEKEIRSAMLEDNIIDAVIGLPPALFYGTGIPAAIIVIRKNRKEDEKILFINADAEYAEEKARNKLRASDIEKISYVYHTKDESNQKYSKLISLEDIRIQDYNLNIRRYVDNSQPAEIEDTKGHLKGGVPLREVKVYKDQYQKFDFDYETLLEQRDDEYLLFKDDSDVKDKITNDENVSNVLFTYQNHLNSWWSEAKDEFSKLQYTKNINQIKSELLESFKDYFELLQTLDRFQISGVFVEWWNSIKYDLKTISSIGFNESLLSDELLIEAFFQDEKDEIDELEIKVSNFENDLNEAVEDVDYEPDSEKEDEEAVKKPTTAKSYLKDAIKELENEDKEEYIKERLWYEKQLKIIENLEKNIKESKAYKKECEYHLIKKLEVKRYGEIEVLANLKEDLENLNQNLKNKKLIDLKEHILKLQNIIQTVPVLTEEEAKELTLKKHHNLIDSELNRSIKDELSTLIKIFENLKNKYKKSLIKIEDELKQSENKIDKYLNALGYFDE